MKEPLHGKFMIHGDFQYMNRTIFLALFTALLPLHGLAAADFKLDIRPARWELRPGLTTTAWTYNDLVPGTPLIVARGEKVVVEAVNHLPVATNIHWHGLEVPNDQDGPGIQIPPGGRYRYEFTASESGTYWYHTHQGPILPQLDRGLYGAFIVKAPEDARYSGDHIFVLDDWYLDANGKRMEGTARGGMERLGNIETVNGKSSGAIEPLMFRAGEIHKLRFINASTAAVHTMRISGHTFRVTHTDGHPLTEPYPAREIVLSPGERVDAEVVARMPPPPRDTAATEAAVANPEGTWSIESDRPELGIRIPIIYRDGRGTQMASPFVPPRPRAMPGIKERMPDAVLELGSVMGMGGMMGMSGKGSSGGESGMHDMHSMEGMTDGTGGQGMMRWTINGASFPYSEPLFAKVGEVVKLRIRNKDTAMMHPMDHPIHIHGTYFLLVSLGGREPERETWKDTINVPAGQYVDIAFVMKNPGSWMLHCHIIDHEDGGMMMTIEVH